MRLSFPRLFGGLCVVWSVARAYLVVEYEVALLWPLVGLSLVAAAMLLRGRWVVLGGILVVALVATDHLMVRPLVIPYGPELLAWMGLAIAVTHGRPEERTLLLRCCLSVVYLFAAVTKVNPSWLAGENLVRLATSRQQSAWLADLPTEALTALAVAVVAVEFWLAIGLWLPSTRAVTAAVGVVMHTGLWLFAAIGPLSWANLAVLNFGLVALYVTFWQPIPALGGALPRVRGASRRSGRRLGGHRQHLGAEEGPQEGQ